MHNSFRTSHFKDYKHLPIYQVLSAEGIGQWPILQGSSWNRSEFNLERLLGQLFTHQVQSIFQLYVTQDEVEPTKDLLQVRYLTIIIFLYVFYIKRRKFFFSSCHFTFLLQETFILLLFVVSCRWHLWKPICHHKRHGLWFGMKALSVIIW